MLYTNLPNNPLMPRTPRFHLQPRQNRMTDHSRREPHLFSLPIPLLQRNPHGTQHHPDRHKNTRIRQHPSGTHSPPEPKHPTRRIRLGVLTQEPLRIELFRMWVDIRIVGYCPADTSAHITLFYSPFEKKEVR